MLPSVPPHHPSASPPHPCDHPCLPSMLPSVTPQLAVRSHSHIVYLPICDTPVPMPHRLAPHVPTLPRPAFIYAAPGPCAGFIHTTPALIRLHLCFCFGSHTFRPPAVPLSHGCLSAPPCSFPPCLAGVLIHRRRSCPTSHHHALHTAPCCPGPHTAILHPHCLSSPMAPQVPAMPDTYPCTHQSAPCQPAMHDRPADWDISNFHLTGPADMH